jgi:isochorismate synthase
MDRVFVDTAEPCATSGSWSAFFADTQLTAALEQAATRAYQTGQATLASVVLPAPDSDPLRVFRAWQQLFAGCCFYWEQPAREIALLGAGTTYTIETHGDERFLAAAQSWRTLQREAVIYDVASPADSSAQGPVLFGGFRFDHLRPATETWEGFPDGLLVLPRWLFSQHAGQTTLTLSVVIRPTDDIARLLSTAHEELAGFVRLMERAPDALSAPGPIAQQLYAHDIWPAENWKQLVEQAVSVIRQGEYAKIVLAREVEVTAGQQMFALAATLEKLRTHYPAAHVFALQRGTRTFIGATPERLLRAHEGTLHTMALAGSMPRGATADEDLRLGHELLNSAKNRQEHEIVAARIRASLEHLCSRIWISDTPELLRLKNIQHLQTAIVGELLPGCTILEALATLHPTPAVGGSPTEDALAFIRTNEHLDRGWYAGPIGWIDLQGNGEFAVALRSALLEPQRARLFAGCGIVADSDSEAEYAESSWKLQVILQSLSGEE